MPGGQLGCSHGARPGEQGGRPADPHGGHVVGGPLRGGPGGSPSGAGRPARLAALEGLRVAEAAGEILLLIPNLAVLGFLELSLGRPAEADAFLSRAIELERAMGVREPAYFRVVPDEVEALVGLGRLDEAEALLAPFEEAAGTSTGPGPSPREPGAGRSSWRRGAISSVRRPRPMRRCGSTITCPFLSSWGGPSWCAERWSAVRRGSGRLGTR